MSQKDIETLRTEVTTAVKLLKRRQKMTWEFMMNDVDAASEKFHTQRLALIEERIQILADGTHPTLLESVIGLVIVAFPVAAVTRGLLSHWSRTMEIGKVAAVMKSKLTGPEAAYLVKRAQKLEEEALRRPGLFPATKFPRNVTALRKPRTEFVRETTEYNANMQRYAALYESEIAASTRGLIKSAAEKAAKPVVSQDQMFDPKAKSKSNGTADASDYLKGVRDWIVRSQNAEEAVLEDMKETAQQSKEIKQLEAIEAFMATDAFAAENLKADYDREMFQRHIEMCLWCTTWDFRPRWIPASRANPVVGRAMVLPHFEAPPLGDKFWKFACDRYYDPFIGDGTTTYAQAGRRRQMGEGPPPPLPPEVSSYYGDKVDEVFGQYPSERLAYNWGNVIAPALLDLNKELGQALERQLKLNKKQMSEPSESDVFYQYLLGLRKVES
ncbi:MAG: hypothetical protein IPI34_04715 [bacterium]|nr:hypothetical protein [bacterium]